MGAHGSSESSLNTGTFARVRAHSFTIGYTDLLVILGRTTSVDMGREVLAGKWAAATGDCPLSCPEPPDFNNGGRCSAADNDNRHEAAGGTIDPGSTFSSCFSFSRSSFSRSLQKPLKRLRMKADRLSRFRGLFGTIPIILKLALGFSQKSSLRIFPNDCLG
jgi:hypothetical protein